MNQTINNTDKLLTPPSGGRGAYIPPSIEIIVLDNEISLALESNPPAGPDEGAQLLRMDSDTNNPFKQNLA